MNSFSLDKNFLEDINTHFQKQEKEMFLEKVSHLLNLYNELSTDNEEEINAFNLKFLNFLDELPDLTAFAICHAMISNSLIEDIQFVNTHDISDLMGKSSEIFYKLKTIDNEHLNDPIAISIRTNKAFYM